MHNNKILLGQRVRSEKGSALVYILIAIALLAALTLTFMEPSSQQTQSQGTFKVVSEISSQADFIRSAVQECVLMYPGGDATIDNGGAGTDPGADHRYPINPNSSHFSTATLGASGDRLVKNIRCPGNPGDDVNHVKIFSASSGKFLPPAPPLFENWQWYNGTDGVFFWIESAKSDAYLQTALSKLDDQFAECEADVIDASGGAIDLDSDTTVSCTSGSTCFRVRMIAGATSVYNGDTDGEEAAASCP